MDVTQGRGRLAWKAQPAQQRRRGVEIRDGAVNVEEGEREHAQGFEQGQARRIIVGKVRQRFRIMTARLGEGEQGARMLGGAEREVRGFRPVAGQAIVIGHDLDGGAATGSIVHQASLQDTRDGRMDGAALWRQELTIDDVTGQRMAEAVAIAGRRARRSAPNWVLLDQSGAQSRP